MKAAILAAGEGARMGPFTASEPKVMIPVGNRPILEHVVRALVDEGVHDIVLIVGYRRERIMSYFQEGKAFGARIEYAVQNKQLGTAHSVLEARAKITQPFHRPSVPAGQSPRAARHRGRLPVRRAGPNIRAVTIIKNARALTAPRFFRKRDHT